MEGGQKDPTRLSVYNDRARHMRNEAEKPGEYFFVHEKTMAERSAVRQPQKAPKTPKFVDKQER